MSRSICLRFSLSLSLLFFCVQAARLYDFLEDVALYSESVLFHLLTLVFPTMRLWSSHTTSTCIQWLYEINRFFGLQGEALYYQPLVERIRDLEFLKDDSAYCRSAANLILTGHSLGTN